MSTKKKIIATLIAIAILSGIMLFTQSTHPQDTTEKEVTLHIVTEEDKQTKVYQTSTSTLKDLLQEQTELQAVFKDDIYGAYLVSLQGKEQGNQGPWWIYTSENNQDCIDMQMCPSLEQVHLQTGDMFVFSFTSDID